MRPEFKEKELNISSVDVMRSLTSLLIFKLDMERLLKNYTAYNFEESEYQSLIAYIKKNLFRTLFHKCKGALNLKREKTIRIYPQPRLVCFLLCPHRAKLWWNSLKTLYRSPAGPRFLLLRSQEADTDDLTAGPTVTMFFSCVFAILILFFLSPPPLFYFSHFFPFLN